MKRSPYILLILLALAVVAATTPGGQTQLTITKDSRMWVDGTSTVHDWTCRVGQVEGSIAFDPSVGAVSRAVVTVPAAAVTCDSGTMNKKAARALRVDAYPTIRYTLERADVAKDGEMLRIAAHGVLELAGAKQDVTATLVAQPADNGAYRFTGTLPIAMSEFGIDPPTAMLGVLKTGDDVTVRFEIVASPGAAGLSSVQ